MSKDAIVSILSEVRANRAKLDGCARHHWTYAKLVLGQPLICDNCGGTMQITDAGMYVKGYIAAGGNAEDVWPGWNTAAPRKGA